MTKISRENAENIIRTNGWLSHMPPAIANLVLENAHLICFQANETIYRYGDPMGGIYGLVSGTVAVNTAPPESTPRLIQLGLPGAWTGEGCFMTGQPRRIELHAVTKTWVMHVPLDAMERLSAQVPAMTRAFAAISIFATDMLVQIIHDLQKRDVDRRLASVLRRMAWTDDESSITISQDSLGIMANASRKQTNAALQKFTTAGWILRGYRSISVIDKKALERFSEIPDGD